MQSETRFVALEGLLAELDEMLDFFRTVESLSQRFVSPAGRGLQIAASLLRREDSRGGVS